MSLLLDGRDGLLGSQQPRVEHHGDFSSSAGVEALECAALAGVQLDPWQERVIHAGLAERVDGSWQHFEVACCVPRQNGKGEIILVRELAGLFVLGEKLLIHSSHQFDTSLEAFRRLLHVIESVPDFDRRVKRVSKSHGEEGIELVGGQRVRFRTRTKGGGRGFTADCFIGDEAMIYPEASHAALMPTLSARPNPQMWYFGSAVDQMVHEHGLVFSRVRSRALRGDEPRLAYFEWSVDAPNPDEVPDEVWTDQDAWGQANPALGIRISGEHIGLEQRSMDRRTFAVERLGVGDWPSGEGALSLIKPEDWEQLTDLNSVPKVPMWFAIDVSPDRAWCSIAVAARRGDGRYHVEIADRRKGTGWVVGRVAELKRKYEPAGFVCDMIGPAGSLLEPLLDVGVEVEPVNSTEHARSCGFFFDAVQQGTLRHLGDPLLASAIRGAATRPMGDSWAWSRKNSSVDITPLVSSTLALGAVARATAGGQVVALWA